MKFDKLKPDLQNLNLAGVKKAASRAARVRVKLSRRQWIAIACAAIVAGVLLVVLLRPRRNFGRTSGDKKKDPPGVLSDYISGGRDCRSSPFHGLPTGSNQTAVIGYTEGL